MASVSRVGHRTSHNIKVKMDAMTRSLLFAGSGTACRQRAVGGRAGGGR